MSGGAVLAVQRPLGGGALEGTAVNDDLCVVVGVDQIILIGIAGDLLGKFAAVDDNGTIILSPYRYCVAPVSTAYTEVALTVVVPPFTWIAPHSPEV